MRRASQLSVTSLMCRTSPLQIETNFCDRHRVVAGVIRSAAYSAITPPRSSPIPTLWVLTGSRR